MHLANTTVIVVGLGRSGVAAARLCLHQGARVLLTDSAPLSSLSEEAQALTKEPGVQSFLGGHERVPWTRADRVVVSPGVPPLAPLTAVAKRGISVVGELAFAWEALSEVPTLAVGGTNGKSTTTALVGSMLQAAGRSVFVGANFGTPLSQAALRMVTSSPSDGTKPFDSLVLEVSSFQAERMPNFHPRAAALLNISADHLDRYSSLDAYAAAKGNMFVTMTEDDTAVIPSGDRLCLREAHRGQARLVTFGVRGDVVVTPDAFWDRLRDVRYARESFRLAGDHNAQNACAAIALAAAVGVPSEAISLGLSHFEGLPHRMVLVAVVRGVRYYDDSKGTNVGAAMTALCGLSEPRAVLIAGGRDKHGSYEPLRDVLRDKGRALVVLGEAAHRIEAALSGVVETVRANSMVDAVHKAHALAHAGDAVLLSPACSSFDMFRDYKERGEAFVQAVQALAGLSETREGAR